VKRIKALIFFFAIVSLICADTVLVLSQEGSTVYAKFDDAKRELEDIYAGIDTLRPLDDNGTSELRMKIPAIKRELGLEHLELEEVNAKIADVANELARLNAIIPAIANYNRDRILRYGVGASFGLIIGIWMSVLILSFVWRRRE